MSTSDNVGATSGNTGVDNKDSSSPKPKAKLNVRNFPRPPLCEKTDRHLVIKWNDVVVADTKEAFWVLETYHPPTYYLPPSCLNFSAVTLSTSSKYQTMCEWKGAATYHDLTFKPTEETVKAKIWSYESPTAGFKDIKSYLCFYASSVPWKCYVDGEQVNPQAGSFYGGWITSEVQGPVKGAPGTLGW